MKSRRVGERARVLCRACGRGAFACRSRMAGTRLGRGAHGDAACRERNYLGVNLSYPRSARVSFLVIFWSCSTAVIISCWVPQRSYRALPHRRHNCRHLSFPHIIDSPPLTKTTSVQRLDSEMDGILTLTPWLCVSIHRLKGSQVVSTRGNTPSPTRRTRPPAPSFRHCMGARA